MRKAASMAMGWALAAVAGAAWLGAAGVAAAQSARATGTIYTWETEDGTVAFADDWKRVPRQYRDAAEKRATGSLSGYERFTPQPAAPAADYADRLAARLQHLDELNAAHEEARQAEAPARGSRILLQTGSQAVPAIEVGETGDGPVVVETKRYLAKGRIVTRHNTIVRQGDKIVAVVKQRQRGETNISRDIRDEATELPY